MLKAIYYNNGFKIMAHLNRHNHLTRNVFYVFRLEKGSFVRMPDRRGAGWVSGYLCSSFDSYDEAVEYIKKTNRKSHHRRLYIM